MKKQKRFLSLLFGCLSFAAMQAQTYVDRITDMYSDDGLVDMQYNITHLRPEGLFKLGTGFNVLTFDETDGEVLTSKFVIATGKTLTPKCIAQAGAQSMVFCEDATHVYFTLLNPVSGAIAYTRSIPRTGPYPVAYTQLSPVDAAYDGSSTMYVLFRCKNPTDPSVWNVVYMQMTVSTGAITGGSELGIDQWDMIPNDIEYVDAQHIYVSGSWRVHSPTTNAYKFMLINLKGTWNIIDITLPNNRPRSLYVNYRNGYLYLVGDSYHPSYLAAGPLAVLRLTDNNNGTMTLNNQYLYSAPGATFFINDVQEEYGVLVASGQLPVFLSGVSSAPRNFLFNTLVNTPMMSEYDMGSNSSNIRNSNIRTVYSGMTLRLFSVAKEDNTAFVMHDLRTDVNATTLNCRHTPLSLYTPDEVVSVAAVPFFGKPLNSSTPPVVATVDSSKDYDWENLCNTRSAATPGEETALPGMRYYPNPADGIVRIENIETATRIRLYDTEGRLLLERALEPGTPSAEIDLTSLAPGIYLLEADQNGERTRARLIRK